MSADIHKSAGILLRGRKLLITRSKGKDFFVSPGGKIKTGESPEEALIRELSEELTIAVSPRDLELFGTFHAIATGEDAQLHMDVFLVSNWQGEIESAHEVEEIAWVGSTLPAGMRLGSIFEHEVIPRLKEQDLID